MKTARTMPLPMRSMVRDSLKRRGLLGLPTTAAATAAVSATTATASAATATAPAPAATTGGLGLGDVDGQLAAVDIAAVEGGNGRLGHGVIAHFDEAEAARLPGGSVGDERDALNLAELGEELANFFFAKAKRQITHINVDHARNSREVQPNRRPIRAVARPR